MQHVGICGSDVRYWQEGAIGDSVLKMPIALGHETAGIVSKVGRNVTSVKVGKFNSVIHGLVIKFL